MWLIRSRFSFFILFLGLCSQVYTPSQPEDETPCLVIRFGNPALYRLAYVEGTCLWLSGWRSVDPSQALRLLQIQCPNFPPVEQGHLVVENLAVAFLSREPGGMASFIRSRRDHPEREAPQNTVTSCNATGVNSCPIAQGVSSRSQLQIIMVTGNHIVSGILSTRTKFEHLPDAKGVEFTVVPTVQLAPLLPNLPERDDEEELVLGNVHFPAEETVRSSALDLVSRFLVYPSENRLKATRALGHPWFKDDILVPAGYPPVPGKTSVREVEGKSLSQWLHVMLHGDL
ncbi:hypothetical protein D9615_000998 [Tricholomella constricta]|uniref:Uncharacterized protein n=1 Tax=Tricholomella constricta TaxID=117010 RepID=A0A8H5HL76_9AGAR|nr:hypothetical protein D9615_000998 [Tricholomella constricta]